jgi:hypothetical protein
MDNKYLNKKKNILISNLFNHKNGLNYKEIADKVLPFYSEYGIDMLISFLEKEDLVDIDYNDDGYIEHIRLYRTKLKENKPNLYNLLKNS